MASIGLATNVSTLLPVLLGVTIARFLVMGHYGMHRKVYPGFKSFVFAEFLVLLTLGAMALRAVLGDVPLLVICTNVTTMAHPVVVFYALGTFGRIARLRERTRQNLLIGGLACLFQAADVFTTPDMARRAVVYSAFSMLLNLRIGLELPFANRRGQIGLTLVCVTYFIGALIHGARVWSVAGDPGYNLATMMLADNFLSLFVFYRILQSVVELYGVFSMNSQLLEQDLRNATAQIERMAQTDPLTGVLNRRGLAALGGEALAASFREKRSASIIMLDLDHFKHVNDSLGHQAGDALLKAVSTLCAGALRMDDVFARFGGEEFVVVAPYTDAREAAGLAERMRRAVESEYFEATEGQRVTASFGVFSAGSGSLDEFLAQADAAMYQAKQAGRNQVVVGGVEAAPVRA